MERSCGTARRRSRGRVEGRWAAVGPPTGAAGKGGVSGAGAGGGHAWGRGGAGTAFSPAPFLLGGGVGAAKVCSPVSWSPTGNQPTACTLALWWLKFGPKEEGGCGGGGEGGL